MGEKKLVAIQIDSFLWDKMKDYAYTERITLRKAVNECLRQFLEGKIVIHRNKKEVS